MAATRKLQGEIDRCLKKVTEGVETFEDIWQKVHNATNSNQKEKYEADLKKEIKKLQRLRDQIKSWIASAEIKDKSTLLDYRKLIETQMERFKVVERETKTKAYSKEGLGAAQKMDPAQKEKEEISMWLVNSIGSLNIQLDQFESEIESLLVGKKKRLDKDKQDRMDELKGKVERHRYHIRKLETLLRMLDNMSVEVDQVLKLNSIHLCSKIRRIKDDVEYYIESSQEPDFEENEYIYDDIEGLDELELAGVVPSSATTDSNGTPNSLNSTSPHSPVNMAVLNHSIDCSSVEPPPSTEKKKPNSKLLNNDESSASKGMVKPTALRPVNISSSPLPPVVSSSSTSSSTLASITPILKQQPTPLQHQQSSVTASSATATITVPPPQQPFISASVTTNIPPSSVVNSSTVGGVPAGSGVTNSGGGVCNNNSSSSTNVLTNSNSSSSIPTTPPNLKQQQVTVLPNNSSQPSTPLTNNVSSLSSHQHPQHQHPSPQQLPSSNFAAVAATPTPTPNNLLPTTPLSTYPLLNSSSSHKHRDSSHHILENGGMLPPPPPSSSSAASSTNNNTVSNDLGSSSSPPSSISSAPSPSPLPQTPPLSSAPSLLSSQTSQLEESSPSALSLKSIAQDVIDKAGLEMPSSESNQQEVYDKCLAPSEAHVPYMLGVVPLGPQPLHKEHHYQYQMVETGYRHLPQPADSERLRHYITRTPVSTPSYYPSVPLPHSDTLDFFQRLSTETLFFIFYYMEGTKAQYLAAKALKKQSWRFHTKYMMWFQRHEEPKVINEDYEQGTYIYFDNEKWSQRKKEGFTFEYKYLEDRELN